jgi:hypothetical protein
LLLKLPCGGSHLGCTIYVKHVINHCLTVATRFSLLRVYRGLYNGHYFVSNLMTYDDFERTWWRLFQNRIVNTNFDIHVLNTKASLETVDCACVMCWIQLDIYTLKQKNKPWYTVNPTTILSLHSVILPPRNCFDCSTSENVSKRENKEEYIRHKQRARYKLKPTSLLSTLANPCVHRHYF